MLTPFSSVLATHAVGMDRLVVGSPSDPPQRVGITVVAAVFFDGTLNNRNNSARRINAQTSARSATVYREHGKADNSFGNYYSNVAIMEFLNRNINASQRQVSIYVEGIGSIDDQGDARIGFMYGSGPTGVVDRVLKGIDLLTRRLAALPHARNEYIERVVIDVYGFSRGSAAARHFVSRRTNLHRFGYFRTTLGRSLRIDNEDEIIFRFVGLYDTVSSFEDFDGIKPTLYQAVRPNFDNDVGELDLAMGGGVRKAVHLTAGDEVRTNFALTDIRSTINAGKGYELRLPGAHSDIGGGYLETSSEEVPLGNARERQWLIDQGWYRGSNGEEKDIRHWQETRYVATPYGPAAPYQVPREIGSRPAIPHNYQFVPLGIMLDLAERQHFYGSPAFARSDPRRNLTLTVPADLQPIQASLHQYALAHDGAHSLGVVPPLPQLRWLRNRYLHRSATGSIGMGAHYVHGLPERHVIHDTDG